MVHSLPNTISMPIILLKDLPEDVRKAILIKQAEIKATKNLGKYSQVKAITQIIREWMEIKPKQS